MWCCTRGRHRFLIHINSYTWNNRGLCIRHMDSSDLLENSSSVLLSLRYNFILQMQCILALDYAMRRLNIVSEDFNNSHPEQYLGVKSYLRIIWPSRFCYVDRKLVHRELFYLLRGEIPFHYTLSDYISHHFISIWWKIIYLHTDNIAKVRYIGTQCTID